LRVTETLPWQGGGIGLWVIFNLFILLLLYIDLRVFHKEERAVSIRSALTWSAVWVGVALAFNTGVYILMGAESGTTFLTGYLIEKSLSVDNLFVFLLIFSYFKVPGKFQHKILFYGILGALIMRCIFIFAGVALLERFHWLIYVMGAFLIVSGMKLVRNADDEEAEEAGVVVRFFHKLAGPPTGEETGAFLERKGGMSFKPTRLFYVLLAVEFTDLVFAIDSIPAILAISNDPFIIYSSNVFAILGLRALFFALAGLMQLFKYLDYGISAILVFVGVKMVVSGFLHIPVVVTLSFIAASLGTAIAVSLFTRDKEAPQIPVTVDEPSSEQWNGGAPH
jgi:tellurite resistance protein TerC